MCNQQLNGGAERYSRQKKYRLTDVDLWKINDHIVEVIVDAGTDANAKHMREMFDLVNNMSPPPSAIVINRENDYSVKMDIWWEIRKKHPFKLVAMVNNGRKSQYFSETLWPKFLGLAFFNERTEAIDWIYDKLSKPD